MSEQVAPSHLSLKRNIKKQAKSVRTKTVSSLENGQRFVTIKQRPKIKVKSKTVGKHLVFCGESSLPLKSAILASCLWTEQRRLTCKPLYFCSDLSGLPKGGQRCSSLFLSALTSPRLRSCGFCWNTSVRHWAKPLHVQPSNFKKVPRPFHVEKCRFSTNISGAIARG